VASQYVHKAEEGRLARPVAPPPAEPDAPGRR